MYPHLHCCMADGEGRAATAEEICHLWRGGRGGCRGDQGGGSAAGLLESVHCLAHLCAAVEQRLQVGRRVAQPLVHLPQRLQRRNCLSQPFQIKTVVCEVGLLSLTRDMLAASRQNKQVSLLALTCAASAQSIRERELRNWLVQAPEKAGQQQHVSGGRPQSIKCCSAVPQCLGRSMSWPGLLKVVSQSSQNL